MSFMSTISSKLVTLALVGAVGVFGAGCGDDDASDGSGGSGNASSGGTGGAGAMGGNGAMGGAGGDDGGSTIPEVAEAAGDFMTLLAAVEEAGLSETLASEGPFTVLAPTDAAFAEIPEEDLDAILADQELLTAILTYHVIAGEVSSEDVVGLSSATTLQGEDIAITVEGDSVILNDTVNVTAVDVEASNGVIHVIDGVLIPPSLAASE